MKEPKGNGLNIELGEFADFAKAKVGNELVETAILTVSDHLNKVADYIYEEYAVRANKQRMEVGFSLNEFKAYIRTLVILRVKYVRGEDRGMYSRLKLEAWHPFIVNSVISTIGRGYLSDYGIEIWPAALDFEESTFGDDVIKKYEIDVSEKKNIERFIYTISRSLRALKINGGIAMAEQLPLDRSGDALVMSFQLVSGEVKAPDSKRHHTQAFVSLLAGICLPVQYLTPRIKYITKDAVDLLIRNVTNFEFAK